MAQHIHSVRHIPVEVQQLAEIHSLGAPTASYTQRTFSLLFVLIGMLCITLFCFGWAIVLFIQSALLGEVLEVLMLTAFIGGFTIYGYLGWWKQQMHLYTEGLVYLRWPKARVLRWDQMETIWYELENSDSQVPCDTLRIRTTDGKELKIWIVTILLDTREIYRRIEREFVRIRLPGMIERYEAGNDIAFGDLSVNKLGLTRKGETLPWNQVQGIHVGVSVQIKKQGQKLRNWFARSVPNPCLLRELVTYIRRAP